MRALMGLLLTECFLPQYLSILPIDGKENELVHTVRFDTSRSSSVALLLAALLVVFLWFGFPISSTNGYGRGHEESIAPYDG